MTTKVDERHNILISDVRNTLVCCRNASTFFAWKRNKQRVKVFLFEPKHFQPHEIYMVSDWKIPVVNFVSIAIERIVLKLTTAFCRLANIESLLMGHDILVFSTRRQSHNWKCTRAHFMFVFVVQRDQFRWFSFIADRRNETKKKKRKQAPIRCYRQSDWRSVMEYIFLKAFSENIVADEEFQRTQMRYDFLRCTWSHFSFIFVLNVVRWLPIEVKIVCDQFNCHFSECFFFAHTFSLLFLFSRLVADIGPWQMSITFIRAQLIVCW